MKGSSAFLKARVFIPIILSCFIIIINPERIRDSFRRFIIPIELVGGKIRASGTHLNEALKDNIILRRENERLKKEIVLLHHKYAKQEGIINENKRLRDILSYKEKKKFKMIVANPLSLSSSLISSNLIIDRGKNDGIKKGLCVVSLSEGKEVFIGRVIDVFEESSLVLLTTDPAFLLPARLERTREKGLLVGLKEKMELKFIPRESPVILKEPVITIADEVIPQDILIGYVFNIPKERGGLFKKIFVQPAISFSRLEEVLVLVP